MPDLIRHPEHNESLDSGFRRNDTLFDIQHRLVRIKTIEPKGAGMLRNTPIRIL